MERNVLDYEPAMALFVPDDDPLRFYRTIAEYGIRALQPAGQLYFEINPLFVGEMHTMLKGLGYENIEVKTDQFGKQRMMRCEKPDNHQPKTSDQ